MPILTVEDLSDKSVIEYKNLLDSEFNKRKLGTLERKNLQMQSFDTDDGKYVYWKNL